MVRERSAKPLCVGSIPTRASKFLNKLAIIEFHSQHLALGVGEIVGSTLILTTEPWRGHILFAASANVSHIGNKFVYLWMNESPTVPMTLEIRKAPKITAATTTENPASSCVAPRNRAAHPPDRQIHADHYLGGLPEFK